MICKYFRKRQRDRISYFYCSIQDKEVTWGCYKNCKLKQYNAYKPIRKKSTKLIKEEKARFSILTNDMEHCYWCKAYCGKDNLKDDLHEIYPGRNRRRSIKYGFVVPLCREHHNNESVKEVLKKVCQFEYEQTHTREEFLQIIDKNYWEE